MNKLFRLAGIDGVIVDDDGTPSKHDSISLREEKTKWKCGNRKKFITYRPIYDWLISDWEHKRRHLHDPNLDFEPVKSGLFYSLRLGGTWVAADWWLNYFKVREETTALRLSHIAEDINYYLLPLLPKGTPLFEQIPRANANISGNGKERFTSEDLRRIKANNPAWIDWATSIE